MITILKINRYFPGTSIKILEPNEIKKNLNLNI